MKFRFLGTCAADFSPRLTGDLSDKFDLDARRSSCSLLDGRFLFDCGYHAAKALDIGGEDKSKITDIFISHLHKDHFLPSSVADIAEKCSHAVRLWVRDDAELPYIPNVKIMRMKNYVTCDVCEDMKITGLPANHAESVCPRHLLIEYRGKKLFYGLDGGWFINGTYNYLKNAHLDFAALDCTCGDYEGDYRMAEHNSIPMIRLMLPSLKTTGCIDGHTVIYASHFAPSLHKPHTETELILSKIGVRAAYDGLEIEI